VLALGRLDTKEAMSSRNQVKPPRPGLPRDPARSGGPSRAGNPVQRGDSTERGGSALRHPPGAVITVKRIFGAETSNYFLLLGTTLFLVVFGLVMVLSSSSVLSFKTTDDFFSVFLKQSLYAIIGVPLMLIASRMSLRFWKKWAWLGILIGIGLQFLVALPGVGQCFQGNCNWINLGAFNAQPSELLKLALAIWLGYILWTKIDLLDDWRHIALPIAPIVVIAVGLVLKGGDLGTSIIILVMVFGALFFAGIKLRFLLFPAALMSVTALIFAFANTSRQSRISAWLGGCSGSADYSTGCWQTIQGWYALASGGVFGVGLGNSKAKWSWLPEVDNDFIFAIIGEELGLLGAIAVLALFVVLTISFIRIVRANTDPFARITASAIMMWITSQALVNIAVVLGLLPVLGVPLPLISAGGSALITTLVAVGVVLSFARHPVEAELELSDQVPAERAARAAAVQSARAASARATLARTRREQ
jgi:cell division protein FtsW